MSAFILLHALGAVAELTGGAMQHEHGGEAVDPPRGVVVRLRALGVPETVLEAGYDLADAAANLGWATGYDIRPDVRSPDGGSPRPDPAAAAVRLAGTALAAVVACLRAGAAATPPARRPFHPVTVPKP